MLRYKYLLFVVFLPFYVLAQTGVRHDLDSYMHAISDIRYANSDSLDYYVALALPVAQQLGDIPDETTIQTAHAGHIFLSGYFDSAVAICLQMIRKGERQKPYIALAMLYYELSGIYGKNGDNEVSGKYIRMGLSLSNKLSNDTARGDGYNRLGVYYERTGKTDSALFYYRKAEGINEQINYTLALSYNLENIAGIYAQENEPEEALYYLRRSLAYRLQLDNAVALAIAYMNMAETFAQLEQYDSSIYYAYKTQHIAGSIHYKDILQYSYKFLSGIYEKKGNYKQSLAWHQRFTDLHDSIFNETKSKQIEELNTKYETEKKEQQIKTLHQKNAIQRLEIKQRNIFMFVGAGLFFTVIIILWLIYNRRRLKQQARFQLAINKQQEATARQVMQAEERERRRIAADLHDGVGQLLSVALMNLNGLLKKATFQPDADKLASHTLALVTESYDELRQISHQMIPNTLLRAGLVSAVRDMLLRIDQDRIAVSLETEGLDSRLNEELETVLYRVIQEAVNNVVKHAQATRLNIQLLRDDEGITVTIEDNGKGLKADELKDKGIGFKNMQSRVAFYKGTVDVDSSIGKGTLLIVFIPH